MCDDHGWTCNINENIKINRDIKIAFVSEVIRGEEVEFGNKSRRTMEEDIIRPGIKIRLA